MHGVVRDLEGPAGQRTVAVPLLPLPPEMVPPAVNAPVAMRLEVGAVIEILTIWKRSAPRTAGLALAAGKPAAPMIAAAGSPASRTFARLLRLRLILVSLVPGVRWLPDRR